MRCKALCVSNKGSVICKEEILYEFLMGPCVGLQPSEVEQAAIKT